MISPSIIVVDASTAYIPSATLWSWGSRHFVYEAATFNQFGLRISNCVFNTDKFLVELNDLRNKDYELKRPIRIIFSDIGDQYLATFPEAEIVVSGETAAEALDWLRETVISSYELFSAEGTRLGPLPKRQLAVLEQYVGKVARPK